MPFSFDELRRPACLNPSSLVKGQGYTLGGNQWASAVGSATCGRLDQLENIKAAPASSQHPCCCDRHRNIPAIVVVTIATSPLLRSLLPLPHRQPVGCRSVAAVAFGTAQHCPYCSYHNVTTVAFAAAQHRPCCTMPPQHHRCHGCRHATLPALQKRVTIAESCGDLDPSKHGEPAAAVPPVPCCTSPSPPQPWWLSPLHAAASPARSSWRAHGVAAASPSACPVR